MFAGLISTVALTSVPAETSTSPGVAPVGPGAVAAEPGTEPAKTTRPSAVLSVKATRPSLSKRSTIRKVVPRIPAGGLAIHPDCGALLFALRRGEELVPAESALDIARLAQALTGYRDGWLTRLRAAGALLRSPRLGHGCESLAALRGLLPGRVNRRLMLLGFTSFCSPDFLDEQRLARCADHVLLAAGTAPVCRHFGLNKHKPEPVPLRTSP